jgi:hypothetical protein
LILGASKETTAPFRRTTLKSCGPFAMGALVEDPAEAETAGDGELEPTEGVDDGWDAHCIKSSRRFIFLLSVVQTTPDVY